MRERYHSKIELNDSGSSMHTVFSFPECGKESCDAHKSSRFPLQYFFNNLFFAKFPCLSSNATGHPFFAKWMRI